METSKICYKMTSINNGVMYSATIVEEDPDFNGERLIITYEIGKEAKPLQGTPIFVFDSLVNAVRFAKPSGVERILECRYSELFSFQKVMPRCSKVWNHLIPNIKEFWRDPFIHDVTSTPAGTILVKSVTPVRYVDQEEINKALEALHAEH